jgi:putative transposase
MYDYRKMTEEERKRVVEYRRRRGAPWHSPPHWDLGISDKYLITAACYEHKSIIGKSPSRLTECEDGILSVCREFGQEIYAWCVLPNHYHILVHAKNLKILTKELGRFHGRSSFQWNGEDERRGRQVWHRCFDRAIRSERHFWASVNYVHHNPVHHGYVEKWTDWLWSSASDFINQIGREKALRIWLDYPILDYGKDWDV